MWTTDPTVIPDTIVDLIRATIADLIRATIADPIQATIVDLVQATIVDLIQATATDTGVTDPSLVTTVALGRTIAASITTEN